MRRSAPPERELPERTREEASMALQSTEPGGWDGRRI